MLPTSGALRKWLAVACVLACLAAPPVFSAPPPPDVPDLNGLFNKAVSTFAAGDYQGSVATIQSLLGALPKDLPPADQAKATAQLEPIYFTLGAAYFNLKDYARAQDALQDYIKRYPKGGRVPEATMSLAQASYFGKDYEAAAKTFATLETNPAYREQALLLEAAAYKEGGKLAEAIGALEKLTRGGIKSPNAAKAGLQLVRCYAEKAEPDKALKTLTDLQANLAQVENVVDFNAAALGQGDAFLGANSDAEALTCYRAVLTKDEVLALQKERIADLQQQFAKTRAAIQADPRNAAQYLGLNRQLQDSIAEDNKLLAEFAQLPSVRSKLAYRMGRAFDGQDKTWESLVAYTDALAFAKDPADREPALFAQASAYAKVNQTEDAQAACKVYLKDFPQGPNAFTVGYLLGATALQDNDAKQAEAYFGRMLVEQPASTMREEIVFLLANAQFAQGEYDKAEKAYRQYQSDFPQGAHLEEAVYRPALGSLFAGSYEEALKRVEAYLAKYPAGQFETDARYRRAVCLYAAQDYPKVLDACLEWLKKFPGDPQQGEVYSLLGDVYAATDKGGEAVDAYTKSYKACLQDEGETANAHDDEVLGYAMAEASKILQKKGDWARLDAMYEEFIKDHPQHANAVEAANWVGRAKAKLGQPEEGKKFIATFANKYIDDPKKDAVDQLLSQLATMCVRKKPAAAVSPAAPGQSPEAATAATPAPDAASADPGAELDSLLGASEKDRSPTAQARVLYAKAELARLRRQPEEAQKNLFTIARDIKPEALSPVILGQVADANLAVGRTVEAEPFYQHLQEYFPKSEVVDFAYNGLGEIAFRKQEYQKALDYFNDGLNKIPANLKLKDLTVGQAKSLLALGKFDEAKKLFEQAAGTREWRGETTAQCVYSLGEVEAKQAHWAEANAYYQRVFVAYQKFLPWVAKAYLGSGESFEKLNKRQEAINTYREMLRNEKLADLPETSAARARLAALGAS